MERTTLTLMSDYLLEIIAIMLAVRMIVTMKLPNAEIISAVTFMTIIITLTFQASTSAILARYLKLDEGLK